MGGWGRSRGGGSRGKERGRGKKRCIEGGGRRWGSNRGRRDEGGREDEPQMGEEMEVSGKKGQKRERGVRACWRQEEVEGGKRGIGGGKCRKRGEGGRGGRE